MKKKYIAPTITIMPIECDGNHLLAGSNSPNTGMDIPTGPPVEGVEGDAKENPFSFDDDFWEERKICK